VSLQLHVVSFAALKGLWIVHIPGSLVGHERQFVPVPMMVISRSPAA
jgi:hypothetical protein